MGLFEETQAASDAEGDAAPRELELDLHRVVVGPVKDRDLAEIDPLVVEFQHPLGDEGGLLVVGREGNERGFGNRRFADGPELLRKLTRVVLDRCVC